MIFILKNLVQQINLQNAKHVEKHFQNVKGTLEQFKDNNIIYLYYKNK